MPTGKHLRRTGLVLALFGLTTIVGHGALHHHAPIRTVHGDCVLCDLVVSAAAGPFTLGPVAPLVACEGLPPAPRSIAAWAPASRPRGPPSASAPISI